MRAANHAKSFPLTPRASIQFPADPSLSGMSMALKGLTIDPAPGAPMRWTNAKLMTLGL